MKYISLTKNQQVIVDDDFQSDRKWQYHPKGKAMRSTKLNGKKTTIWMHREVWEQYHGKIPDGMQIDHINHDGLDNRIENLRLATNAQNQHNSRKLKAKTSIQKGVSLHTGGKWEAGIWQDGKRHYLGHYDSEQAAAIAYNNAAIERFGERACLNLAL